MNLFSKLLLACCCVCASQAYARDMADSATISGGSSCGSGCACGEGAMTPAGVQTDHMHPKGEWMLSYTFMNMAMKGDKEGAKSVSDDEVARRYMMIPRSMNMSMHMLMAMYGLTDRLTLMGMGGYTTATMDMYMPAMSMPGMIMRASAMSSSSSGIADTRISGLYNLLPRTNSRLIGSLGVGIPTGTIKATGVTMLGANERLPYNMQPGTGSFALLPGITFVARSGDYACGADAGADVKLNYNSLGYKQGDSYHLSLWASRRFFDFVSFSLRAEAITTEKLHGQDPQMELPLYQLIDPTTQTANYGGEWVNAHAGLNFHLAGKLSKFQLLTEYGMPVYQYANGEQIASRGVLTATLRYKL